ncbi:RseA family anti-sigma factor [Vibrio sp. SCSIO 43136]|uniref:RseA family anti-sigma factor n=1 Tax=Vibrio sp. SCSIO 43136 TaxID=2819101 RepID=UPI002075A5A1|nr:RseA family anti-sigma factor [Vibrio sp. SCSIO 43136]USD65650.1 anti-sigma E factor [Vibrio sp. SCSIO 43136]
MVKIMADKEQLSALMDGESVDQALISELEHDAESQKSWQNYHLIGDVMRGEAPAEPKWDIASNVMAALEDEPAHSTVTSIDTVAPKAVEDQPMPAAARTAVPAWLSQIGQVAMAACVSLAVIVGVQQYGAGNEAGQIQSDLPILETIPVTGSAQPVSLNADNVNATEAQMMEQRRRVNAILQDYNLQLRLNGNNVQQEPQVQPEESVIE